MKNSFKFDHILKCLIHLFKDLFQVPWISDCMAWITFLFAKLYWFVTRKTSLRLRKHKKKKLVVIYPAYHDRNKVIFNFSSCNLNDLKKSALYKT